MRAVIIEDEKLTAEDLRATLEDLGQGVQVVKVLSSVREALAYFSDSTDADIIFSDIELGDGKCFDIFRQVNLRAPVIFSTAYDDHALEAFRYNAIDYVLKPFRREDLRRAVGKWNDLRRTVPEQQVTSPSVLVNWKDRIIPLRITEIAYFHLHGGNMYIMTLDGRRFPAQETLDEYTKRCGVEFFRVNRQFLVNRHAVTEAVHHTHRKLLVRVRPECAEEITLAKARVPEFLHWLGA